VLLMHAAAWQGVAGGASARRSDLLVSAMQVRSVEAAKSGARGSVIRAPGLGDGLGWMLALSPGISTRRLSGSFQVGGALAP
jgi:hypothetical protein